MKRKKRKILLIINTTKRNIIQSFYSHSFYLTWLNTFLLWNPRLCTELASSLCGLKSFLRSLYILTAVKLARSTCGKFNSTPITHDPLRSRSLSLSDYICSRQWTNVVLNRAYLPLYSECFNRSSLFYPAKPLEEQRTFSSNVDLKV